MYLQRRELCVSKILANTTPKKNGVSQKTPSSLAVWLTLLMHALKTVASMLCPHSIHGVTKKSSTCRHASYVFMHVCAHRKKVYPCPRKSSSVSQKNTLTSGLTSLRLKHVTVSSTDCH